MPIKPRLFADDDAIRRVGEGMMACSLDRAEWTHEAHLAPCVWLLIERPEIVPERDLPALIRRYNEAVGGINDDDQGYHETITQVFVASIRHFLAGHPGSDLRERVNALLQAAQGAREWPLRFYSRDRLFGREARRGWVEPDLEPFPWVG